MNPKEKFGRLFGGRRENHPEHRCFFPEQEATIRNYFEPKYYAAIDEYRRQRLQPDRRIGLTDAYQSVEKLSTILHVDLPLGLMSNIEAAIHADLREIRTLLDPVFGHYDTGENILKSALNDYERAGSVLVALYRKPQEALDAEVACYRSLHPSLQEKP